MNVALQPSRTLHCNLPELYTIDCPDTRPLSGCPILQNKEAIASLVNQQGVHIRLLFLLVFVDAFTNQDIQINHL